MGDVAGRRRSQGATKRTSALAAENERLQRELEWRVEQLERERDFIATVVDSTSTLFCVIDSDGAVVRFNEPLGRLSGRTRADAGGQKFWDVFVVRREAADFRRRLASADGVEHETAFYKEDGSTAIVAWSRSAITGEDGRPQILFSGIDVTERKREREQLLASRARVVEAADNARRRIERDLHDGAQQRLVALSLAVRLAAQNLSAGRTRVAAKDLARVEEELATALEELRELARGIHPAILSERGLPEALEMLAVRSPVPVEVERAPRERLPEKVEATIYYVVSEALANVAKYSRARVASVRVFREDEYVVTEVEDDGIGGADANSGSGLRGLADRVEALEGALSIVSPRGGPTLLRATVRESL
jgi:PAS domain S-box-containing protein